MKTAYSGFLGVHPWWAPLFMVAFLVILVATGGCAGTLGTPIATTAPVTGPTATATGSVGQTSGQITGPTTGGVQANPEVIAPAPTELIVVEHKATIAEAGCSLSFQGKETAIRIAARGAAQAPAGQGVDIFFRLNEGQEKIAFDTMSASSWSPTLSAASLGQGRPLLRNEGDRDSTAWSGTFEGSVEDNIQELDGVVLIMRFIPGSPTFSLLATTEFNCKAPEEAPTPTATVTISPTSTPTPVPTPTPKLEATINPARDVTGVWKGGINLVPAEDQTGCSQWSGPLVLDLKQTAGDIEGTVEITFSKLRDVETGAECGGTALDPFESGLDGKVSSSAIEFSLGDDAFATFTGSFTTDLMGGDIAWEFVDGDVYRGCFQVSRTSLGALPDCGNKFVATPTPTPLPPTPTQLAPTPTPAKPTATPTRTPTPIPAEQEKVTIDSANCSLLRTFDKNGYNYGEWEITASGTASGPVGTQVEMPNWLGYKNYTANVGWTKVFGAFAKRDQGQSYTTDYSIRFTIESNYNPGYGPGTYEGLGASISGPNAYTVFFNVVCPAP